MKVDKVDLVNKLVEAINSLSEEKNPSRELIAMGLALAKIGRELKDIPLKKAQAAITTIKYMHDSGLMDIEDEKPKLEQHTSHPERE